jgi:hypothetical protein
MCNSSWIHWMSWERMGIAKFAGGLGFRDLPMFNKALLAKQVWRIHQNPKSLVARIFKAKYFSKGSVLEASLGGHDHPMCGGAWFQLRNYSSKDWCGEWGTGPVFIYGETNGYRVLLLI